jgi:large subunit ribosomal protein L13
MRTYSPRPRDIERRWYVIDASGAVLGRLASEVAAVLRGKHKPIFAPHMDTGDHVIVVNAAGVRLTGNKLETKIAYRHSGYPGGLTEIKYARLLAERPVYAVEKAIKGMLPKNKLGRAMARKLQVYAGPEHPHRAQDPQPLRLGEVPKWEGLPTPKAKTAPEAKEPKEKASKKKASKKPVAKRVAAKEPVAKRASEKAAAAKAPAAKEAAAKRKEAAPERSAVKVPAKAKPKAAAKSAEKTPTRKRITVRRAKKEE